jgi:Domain of unknown function (DUF6602)
MTDWSLSILLSGLHDEIQQKLATARKVFAHPGTKGDASESVWLEMLKTYLPQRYRATKGHVVDSNGGISDQIDILIFDRQYSPFIFEFQGKEIVPAEAVYAAFEAKQSINATQVDYAHKKVKSVRELHRTSLPIPTAMGVLPAKPLHHIIGGLVTFESDWSPPLGKSLLNSLASQEENGRLDLGCVAAHGIFTCDLEGYHVATPLTKAATAFLFELIARLQSCATVPMIDIRSYAKWLAR